MCSGGTKPERSRPCAWSVAIHWQSLRSVLRPGRFLTCLPLTTSTSSSACSLSQSRRAWSWPVVVPNTCRVSPATETWRVWLPTSMPAAFGSRTGRVCIGVVFLALASGVPDPCLRRTNLPNGNTAHAASPNKPSVADRNHSLPRAACARQRARRPHCTPQTKPRSLYQVQGHKSRHFAGRGISPCDEGAGRAC